MTVIIALQKGISVTKTRTHPWTWQYLSLLIPVLPRLFTVFGIVHKILTPQTSHTDGHVPVSPKASTKAASFSSSSGKLTIQVKLTRSKAWLEEYAASEDPIKMFLAAVYDHHDPMGELVAEPFHELPSPKVELFFFY